jgi:hypothetical protein
MSCGVLEGCGYKDNIKKGYQTWVVRFLEGCDVASESDALGRRIMTVHSRIIPFCGVSKLRSLHFSSGD